MWSLTKVYKQYTDSNGTKIQKRALIDAISKHFGERLLLLPCKGLATFLVFRTCTSQLVQLVEEPDGDFQAVKSVAKQILTESKAINPFSTSPAFGQVQKFFFRKFIASSVFMLERYIRSFFFLEKTLNFFSYRSEKTGKSSHK